MRHNQDTTRKGVDRDFISLGKLTQILYCAKVKAMKTNPHKAEDLYTAILNLKNLNEAKLFFRDLLTEDEIEEFSLRWKVAGMLDKDMPYTSIQEKTGLSSTTIARISRWLHKGKGGYRLMLDRLHHAHPSHEKRRT